VGLAAAAIGIGVVAVIGLQEGLGRFLSTSPYEVAWSARRQVYAATLELWQRFPVSGAGLGTFREAFPLVQPPGLEALWRHAHSGPLEMLATAGVLGALLLAAGFLALLAALAGVLREGRRSEDRAAGLAALGMLAAVAVHEAFDFGLTLPANAFSLAVLAGAAASAKRSREPRRRVPLPIVPAASAAPERDRAGQDRAAGDAADLQQVEPGPEKGSVAPGMPGRHRRDPSRRRRH
jgi:O-antigen ligase